MYHETREIRKNKVFNNFIIAKFEAYYKRIYNDTHTNIKYITTHTHTNKHLTYNI